MRARMNFTIGHQGVTAKENRPDLRKLELAKTNRGRARSIETLAVGRWTLRAGRAATSMTSLQAVEVEDLFMTLLDKFNEQNRHVRVATGRGYAP